ncbi:MAG: hypothetical protein WBQ73_01785, partial [Candidatus Babeliales bacterium]
MSIKKILSHWFPFFLFIALHSITILGNKDHSIPYNDVTVTPTSKSKAVNLPWKEDPTLHLCIYLYRFIQLNPNATHSMILEALYTSPEKIVYMNQSDLLLLVNRLPYYKRQIKNKLHQACDAFNKQYQHLDDQQKYEGGLYLQLTSQLLNLNKSETNNYFELYFKTKELLRTNSKIKKEASPSQIEKLCYNKVHKPYNISLSEAYQPLAQHMVTKQQQINSTHDKKYLENFYHETLLYYSGLNKYEKDSLTHYRSKLKTILEKSYSTTRRAHPFLLHPNILTYIQQIDGFSQKLKAYQDTHILDERLKQFIYAIIKQEVHNPETEAYWKTINTNKDLDEAATFVCNLVITDLSLSYRVSLFHHDRSSFKNNVVRIIQKVKPSLLNAILIEYGIIHPEQLEVP